MIILMPRFWRYAAVVWWYTPTPWWKLWRGYKPGIIGSTLYCGPLKIAVGPR